MYDPHTKEEAAKKRYNTWAGNLRGSRFDATCCAYEVQMKGSWQRYQCSRKPGHGPDQLYCRQHAAKIN